MVTICSDLLISHATLPLSSITSEAVQYPIRRSTLLRHFNSSICSSDFFFLSSDFIALISFPTYKYIGEYLSQL